MFKMSCVLVRAPLHRAHASTHDILNIYSQLF
jgi:hypothetical protein